MRALYLALLTGLILFLAGCSTLYDRLSPSDIAKVQRPAEKVITRVCQLGPEDRALVREFAEQTAANVPPPEGPVVWNGIVCASDEVVE